MTQQPDTTALLPVKDIAQTVRQALAEDVGSGDVNAALINASTQAQATLLLRQPAVLAGQAWFETVFSQLSKAVEINWQAHDGQSLPADTVVCELSGPAQALLTGERTAINFLQMLSGVATRTQHFVKQVAGTRATIVDTRKTVPGLRAAQKYAVCCGGGKNHRFGLFDAFLIKENHIAAAGGISHAVKAASQLDDNIMLQVEVENLAELEQALKAGVDALLLDNFALDTLEAGVETVQKHNQSTGLHVLTEASGNVDDTTVAAIAQTGVDRISIGALTKHIQAADFSLRLQLL